MGGPGHIFVIFFLFYLKILTLTIEKNVLYYLDVFNHSSGKTNKLFT